MHLWIIIQIKIILLVYEIWNIDFMLKIYNKMKIKKHFNHRPLLFSFYFENYS